MTTVVENKKVENAYQFVNELDTITVLETLDAFQTKLYENPTEETYAEIKAVLEKWEIITAYNRFNQTTYWMEEPFQYTDSIKQRSLPKRIGHFLKTRGEWMPEHNVKRSIDAPLLRSVPLLCSITESTKKRLDAGTIDKLLVAIVDLHGYIMLRSKLTPHTLGIFERPYGTNNRNLMVAWLERMQERNEWQNIIHNIHIMSIYELVNEAECHVL